MYARTQKIVFIYKTGKKKSIRSIIEEKQKEVYG